MIPKRWNPWGVSQGEHGCAKEKGVCQKGARNNQGKAKVGKGMGANGGNTKGTFYTWVPKGVMSKGGTWVYKKGKC